MFFPVVTIFLTKVSSFLENISSVCQSIPLFYEDLMFFPKVSLTLKLSSLFPEGFKYFPTITSLLRRTRVDWFSRDDCIYSYIEKSIIKGSLLSLKYFTNIVSSFASEGFKYFLKVSSIFEDFMNFSNVTISLLRKCSVFYEVLTSAIPAKPRSVRSQMPLCTARQSMNYILKKLKIKNVTGIT